MQLWPIREQHLPQLQRTDIVTTYIITALYGYGLYGYGLYSHGLCSYGLSVSSICPSRSAPPPSTPTSITSVDAVCGPGGSSVVRRKKRENFCEIGACCDYTLMALYSYGPIYLWHYILMAIYSHDPI